MLTFGFAAISKSVASATYVQCNFLEELSQFKLYVYTCKDDLGGMTFTKMYIPQ